MLNAKEIADIIGDEVDRVTKDLSIKIAEQEAVIKSLTVETKSLRERIAESTTDAVKTVHQKSVEGLSSVQAELATEAANRAAADAELLEKLEAIEIPELPDIDAIVAEAVEKAVAEAVAAIPAPADGKDGEQGPPGEKGADGRDGLDVKDMFRSDGGRLIAVMSDGTTKDLGEFVGKDGAPGAPGKDGVDGVGFEDLEFTIKDGRAIAEFRRGEIVKSVQLPGIVYRETYKHGKSYVTGDAVTWGGNLWIAQEDTTNKPGTKSWRLAVKSGRDAKGA